MIFVTVGTHEQPFNRLIQKVDELVRDGEIKEEVFMQIGYSNYEPKYTKWAKVIGYDAMSDYLKKADIVIAHGGPSTYMQVLQNGKIPIVVPRQEKFNEHVNDHQLDVTRKVRDKGYLLNVCYDIDLLIENIEQSKKASKVSFENHNTIFMDNFIEIVNSL